LSFRQDSTKKAPVVITGSADRHYRYNLNDKKNPSDNGTGFHKFLELKFAYFIE